MMAECDNLSADDPDPQEMRRWLEDFERCHGRPLRVLHIGNIANNAYNNAKVQRERGIAADVLSHDYYHIMACPEWEDAPFEGGIADDNFPDWWAVDLKGFKRPRWFAQGPMDASIRYLLAHTAGEGARAALLLWWALEAERWLLNRRSRSADWARRLFHRLTGREIAYVAHPANAFLAHTAARVLERLPLGAVQARRLKRLHRTANMAEDVERHRRAQSRRRDELVARANALLAPLGRSMPPEDLDWYFMWWWHPYMRLLLRRYDIVQAYATYTMIPFIQGFTDYVAYEHGTIRAIPFQETAEGRTCAATYRAAAKVLITNSDNVEAADALRIDPERQVFLPHAFDSDKLLRFARDNPPPPRSPGTPAVFFSPTRQHWVGQDPGWAKGNDRVVEALAAMAREGLPCRLRLVEWGRDVEPTRALAAERGVADRIEWLPVMTKRELWREYLRSDAVIDQFLVGAMGGVTFEAMILGRRVISAIDVAQAGCFFGEAPPLFVCWSAADIATAMRRVILDPDDAEGAGARNRAWMERYHSADRIVILQLAGYRDILEIR